MKQQDIQEEVPIQINGVAYTMSFTFGDLADGEAAAHNRWRQWHVNLFQIYIAPTMVHVVKDVFAASLERHHPEMPFNDRRKLVTLANFTLIAGIQWRFLGGAITEARKDAAQFSRFARVITFHPRPAQR